MGNKILFVFFSILGLFILYLIIESWPVTLVVGALLLLLYFVTNWTVKKSPVVIFALMGAAVGQQITSSVIHAAERGQEAWLETIGSETVTFIGMMTGIIILSALYHVVALYEGWKEARQQNISSS